MVRNFFFLNRVCWLLILFLGYYNTLSAQKGPRPHRPQSLLLAGATIHQGNGQVITNGAMCVKDSLIVWIGPQSDLPQEYSKYTRIDVSNKHLYPGLIALNTQLGLSEIEAVAATNDFEEIGSYTPNVRALIAYNTDSQVIPTVRCNGVLMAETVPTGGIISGQSSLMQLDAWNWEDAVIQTQAGIHMNWPRKFVPRGPRRQAAENTSDRYTQTLLELTAYFDQALAYGTSANPVKNLMLEALSNAIKNKTRFFIHADDADQIVDVVHFINKYQLNGVLVGGAQVEPLIATLKIYTIPVILQDIHRLPPTIDASVDQPFALPSKLKHNDVLYAISVAGFWQIRNLSYHAGQSVPFGIDKEEALKAITLNPAKILGMDHKVGSLEAGKHATFIITEGDILDMKSSEVEAAYIMGRLVDLANKQSHLYEKFVSKYNEK